MLVFRVVVTDSGDVLLLMEGRVWLAILHYKHITFASLRKINKEVIAVLLARRQVLPSLRSS